MTYRDNYFGEPAGSNNAIDTRTVAGPLVLNVVLSVAQWERETTGARIRETLRRKVTSGERGISLETAAKIAAYLKLDLLTPSVGSVRQR